MTLQELCKKYKLAESTVKQQFTRVAAKIEKDTGILIVKTGRGANVQYEEIFPERALTFEDEEVDEIKLSLGALGLQDWQLLMILCTLIAPMGVFRGNAESFLEYFHLPVTPGRIKEVNAAVQELSNNEWVQVIFDTSTDDGYFILCVKRKMEEDIIVKMPYIQTCRAIMDKYNKKSFLPLLKTWLATEELQKFQPYTFADIEGMTGLSAYQIRESNKLLEKENVYQTKKVYVDPTTCLGRNVDLNAFIPPIDEESN